ncbi:MAG: hypothetical protein JWP04_393 [Belnapia sp.]|nr:hypothetical protein [Belnapia sp.]
MRHICLVGAGSIARVHAEALRGLPGLAIVAVVDPSPGAARNLAEAFGVRRTHASVAEALAEGGIDAAHVLVPPDLHAAVALPFLAAGKSVLVEKPMAVSGAQCAELAAAAAAGGTQLGVNQNFIFHPAFARARALIAAGRFGRPRFVDCLYNVPLRQLAARAFGHWMFHEPGNILLEQAVHPLSQIAAIAGPIGTVRAIAGPPVAIGAGLDFYPSLTATLDCAALPAQLRFAVGQNFPFWQVSVICDDGVVVADILANRCYAHTRTRWLDVADGVYSGLRTAGAVAGSGLRNALDYGLSTLRLKPRSDSFFTGMQGSIAAFHAALDGGPAFMADAAFGTMLVETCERLRDDAFGAAAPAPALALAPKPAPLAVPLATPAVGEGRPDIAILGGTGFIGTATVRRSLAAGLRVAVMARSTRNLPADFADPRVTLQGGDIRDAVAVGRAIAGAPVVVNLAHGGGGANYAQIRAAMVGGAETVARAALAAGARRLVHVGSIASLYLGPQDAPITGATPPDPQAEQRGDYARAKAVADLMLLEMHAREALPVVILRPGLVVGEGTSPFHSGLGFYNAEQHCIGWNRGTNPLPFVLVEDVAEAILLAAKAPGIEGRCYNLVGDVRPTARAYIADLARATGRPLRFHPQWPEQLWAEEMAKWLVKRAGGRAVPLPPKRDIVSRGLLARFDCSDAKRDLGWHPVADPAVFAAQAIAIHAPT